jgi:putative ABC transport system substrate-binding protein
VFDTRRRDFIALLGGAGLLVATKVRRARAQQPTMPVIGFLHSASPDGYASYYLAGFRQGLKEAGYVEGQNVAIEYRWAEGQYDRLPALVADLINRQVMIAATGGDPSALAAKAATATIPIVFNSGSDPVKLGLVAGLNRPGGNATGVSLLAFTLIAKQLELLCELVPTAATVAFLVNSNNSNTVNRTTEMQETARAVGRQLYVVTAGTEADLEAAFAAVQRNAGALFVPPRPIVHRPPRTTRRTGGTACNSHQLSISRVRYGWRLDELRHQPCRWVSPCRHLYGPDSQGGKACRSPGATDGEGRADHQHEDRQDARSHLPAYAAWSRR